MNRYRFIHTLIILSFISYIIFLYTLSNGELLDFYLYALNDKVFNLFNITVLGIVGFSIFSLIIDYIIGEYDEV